MLHVFQEIGVYVFFFFFNIIGYVQIFQPIMVYLNKLILITSFLVIQTILYLCNLNLFIKLCFSYIYIYIYIPMYCC